MATIANFTIPCQFESQEAMEAVKAIFQKARAEAADVKGASIGAAKVNWATTGSTDF